MIDSVPMKSGRRSIVNLKETEMNRDQVKGRAKEVAGKVEKIVGRAVDSPRTEAKGIAKEITGKVQKTVGDVRSDFKSKL
jgi:uncharacterized protein YjbJ (UPF0337 family)